MASRKNQKKIVNTFLIDPSASFAAIARLTGTSRATVRNAKRKSGSGRIPGFNDTKLALKVRNALVSKLNISLRDLAKKNQSVPYVHSKS